MIVASQPSIRRLLSNLGTIGKNLTFGLEIAESRRRRKVEITVISASVCRVLQIKGFYFLFICHLQAYNYTEEAFTTDNLSLVPAI